MQLTPDLWQARQKSGRLTCSSCFLPLRQTLPTIKSRREHLPPVLFFAELKMQGEASDYITDRKISVEPRAWSAAVIEVEGGAVVLIFPEQRETGAWRGQV